MREPRPSVGCIDSPTAKATEVAKDRGSDGGKKITGRKHQIIVDTLGLLLVVVVTVASADDGRLPPEVLGRLTAKHLTRLEKVWADGTYHNHHLNAWLEESEAEDVVEVVSGPPALVPARGLRPGPAPPPQARAGMLRDSGLPCRAGRVPGSPARRLVR